MMPSQHQVMKQRGPYRRSPLLIAAYGTLALAIALLLLGSGLIWSGGAAGLAIALALGEIVAQLRRRT